MIRVLYRPTLVLSLIFTCAILLIQSQPYDDTELLAFLALPDSCLSPCFMGIRPGATTVYQAFDILDQHEWVSQVETSNTPYITWTWSGLQPPIIDPESVGRLLYHNETVGFIEIQTTAFIGNMVLVAGKPPLTDSGANGLVSDVAVRGVYPERSLEIKAYLSCPVRRKHFWDAPMRFVILSDHILNGMTGFSAIDYFC
jgi:hypothetical protein